MSLFDDIDERMSGPVFVRMLLHEGHPDAVPVENFWTGETEWLESDAALRKRIKAALEKP
jgi:phage-related baseplate assembly protein